MPAPPAWTDTDTTELKRLHAAGNTLHGIARQMGRSKATISKYAGQLGLSWSRERTAKAAEAVHLDNKLRREKIVARMYTRIEHLQDRLEAVGPGTPFKTLVSAGKDGDTVEELDFVPTTDERNIADTLSRYVASATKLEAVDAGNKPAAVRDLLTGLAESLGITDAR